MRLHLALLGAIAAPTLAVGATAQVLTFAEGAPASLTIVSVPENDPNSGDTVVLQSVELLDLEVTGRTLAQANDPSRTRRVILQGIARAELPGGARLFRYRRSSGAVWGFLHVAADGTPRAVLEAPGVGAGGLSDPFLDRIGIAPDGLHAAIALAAGGMYVVRLDGGTFASTGRADRLALPFTERVVNTSVMIGSTHVFCQVRQPVRVFRCALADGALPVDVSPPPVANGEFKDQMALSRDGSTLVFLYGPDDLERLWLVGTVGGVTALPPPGSNYEEPNYLPEDPGEPAMLLSDDGSRLFYIDSDVRDELYLLDTTGALAPLAMTEDAVFQPYIGTHILPRFAADRLTIAIGDIAQMDWFQARLTTGGGTVVNLTVTGAATQPFPSGTIDPRQAIDGGNFLLLSEQQGAQYTLRRVDPTTGAQSVLQQGVTGTPQIGATATDAVDVLVRTQAGDTLIDGTAGFVLGTLPPDLLLSPPIRGPDFHATWLHLDVGWGVSAYYFDDAIILGQIDFQLPQIALTANGGAVEMGNPVRYLGPANSALLNRPAASVRICLSGVGN
jgi:hypothetical protein